MMRHMFLRPMGRDGLARGDQSSTHKDRQINDRLEGLRIESAKDDGTFLLSRDKAVSGPRVVFQGPLLRVFGV